MWSAWCSTSTEQSSPQRRDPPPSQRPRGTPAGNVEHHNRNAEYSSIAVPHAVQSLDPASRRLYQEAISITVESPSGHCRSAGKALKDRLCFSRDGRSNPLILLHPEDLQASALKTNTGFHRRLLSLLPHLLLIGLSTTNQRVESDNIDYVIQPRNAPIHEALQEGLCGSPDIHL